MNPVSCRDRTLVRPPCANALKTVMRLDHRHSAEGTDRIGRNGTASVDWDATSVGLDTFSGGAEPLWQFEKHRKIPSKAENWVRRESVR
ncbi:hypothetical protein MPL3365_20014 [Mesorhizobium plurifarium]|uniref:Uncharacterized protein n=1 Tax=Mesorhizobium plurifarium TaxID=69974 RepID=A0A090GTV6_MESPL|nr:hypothetical protein MPL3365_20014 [Mesorhizobium plurifarium]